MKSLIILAIASMFIGCATTNKTELFKQKAVEMSMKGDIRAVECFDKNWTRDDLEQKCFHLVAFK